MKPSEKCKAAGLKSLADYIADNFDGTQRKFADAQGVKPPQVTQWLNAEFMVSGDEMYSHRRTLKRAT
jgi:DNA-binding transcriptional regulator YdaS (Cro superfamily)